MTTEAKALAAALAGMTQDQQRQHEYISELCNGVRDSLLQRIPKLPPEWDGHEMRELLYDYVSRCRSVQMQDRRGKRYRSYEAHCLTYNLY